MADESAKFKTINISKISGQKNPRLKEDFDFHMRYTYFRTKQHNGRGQDKANPIDTFKDKNNNNE